MNFENFLKAVKVLIQYKTTILETAKTTSNQVELIYNLILSVLTAYESIKGNKGRGLDEDSQKVMDAYNDLSRTGKTQWEQ